MPTIGSYTAQAPATYNDRLNHAASVAAAPADLLYVSDKANGYVKPAGQITDQGSAAATQRLFASLFAGVSNSTQSASDSTARRATVSTAVVFTNYPCESATYEIGDMVAPTYTAGVLSNQQLSKVTDPTRAIGKVRRKYSTATTTLEVEFTSRILSDLAADAIADGTVTAPPGTSTSDAGDALTYTGGQGFYSSASTASAGGAGVFRGGDGGATSSGTAGASGGATLGGAAGGAAATGTPGAGGTVTVVGDSGGAATAGTANGGAGGDVVIKGGTGGTSSGGAAGADGKVKVGTVTADLAGIKGIYLTQSSVSVAVPSITDPDIAKVDVDVSAALTYQPAVGDAVIAVPQEALPSNARLQGAWVTTTDTVQVTFGSEGGNVTGASKNFKFLFIDLT